MIVVLIYAATDQVSFVFIRNYSVLFTTPLINILPYANAIITVLDDLIFITAPDGMRLYSIDPTFTYLSLVPYPTAPW